MNNGFRQQALLHLRKLTMVAAGVVPFLSPLRPEGGRVYGQTQQIESYGFSRDYGQPDKMYIQSLLQSGFYDLAQQYVESRIANKDQSAVKLSNADAQWLMLWAEVQASKIASYLNEQFDTPAVLSEKLEEISKRLVSGGEDPRVPWLEWKSAWCRWSVLRDATALHLGAPTRIKLREWCLSELREGIDRTDRLIDTVKSISTKDLPQTKPDGMDASQVSSLLADSYLLKCDFLVLRASSYPYGSDDRIAAGTQMLTTLDEAEIRIAQDAKDRDKLLVARAKSYIFSGTVNQAIEIVEELLKSGKLERKELLIPAAAIAAEAYRTLQDMPRSQEWLERAGGWRSSPILAIEHFTNLVGNPGGSEVTAQQLELALATKKEIASLFGAYWESRVEAIMLSIRGNSGTDAYKGPNLSLELVRTEVRQLLLAKRPLDAIEKMAQVEFTLAERNATGDALGLAMQSAAIWGLQKEYINAANEFHRAAMSYPKERLAAESALNAVAMLRERLKILSEQTVGPEIQSELASVLMLRKQFLRDIVEMWPSSAQSDTAISEMELTLIADGKVLEIVDLWLARLERIEPQSADPRKIQEYVHRASTWGEFIAAYGSSPWLEKELFPREAIPSLPEKFARLHSISRSHLASTADEDRLGGIFQKIGWEPVLPVEIPNWGQDVPLLSLIQRWTRCEMALQNALLLSTQDSADTSGLRAILKQSASLREPDGLAVLGVKLREHLLKSVDYYLIAGRFLEGDRESGVTVLKERESQSRRDPWWIYKTARLLSTQVDLRESALERYRLLASGFREGSDAWLDCRARSIDLLVLQKKSEEAERLYEIITSLYADLPEKWKRRLKPK